MNIPSVKKTTAMYNKYPGADTGGRGTFAPLNLEFLFLFSE